MADTRVARRYALALFQSSNSTGTAGTVENDLNLISAHLSSNEDFRKFFFSPERSRQDKNQLISAVFGSQVSPITIELTKLMLSKGREADFSAVAVEFSRLRREAQSIIHAVVTSTSELGADQKSALIAKLQTQIGKTIEAEYKIDPSLIGGLKVAYGDFILDGSVTGSITKLREHLRHDLLKQA